MAAELVQDGLPPGLTVYTVLRNPANQVWTGSAFAAYSTSNRNGGVLTTTGDASGTYAADLPGGVTTPGLYRWAMYQRAGGSPAESDVCLASDVYRVGADVDATLAALAADFNAAFLGPRAVNGDGVEYRTEDGALRFTARPALTTGAFAGVTRP